MPRLGALPQHARAALLCSVLGALAIACGARRSVVEAPMTSADAAASALALGRPPGAPSTSPAAPPRELPLKVGDRFTGTYSCNQGKTELVLVIDHVEPRDGQPAIVAAVFEFTYTSPANGSPYASATGTARMAGTYEPATKRLRLDGEEWIDQPANYRLINLVGTLDKAGAYAGTVEGPGCTRFSATRDTTP